MITFLCIYSARGAKGKTNNKIKTTTNKTKKKLNVDRGKNPLNFFYILFWYNYFTHAISYMMSEDVRLNLF